MILADSLIYKSRQRVNKLASNQHQEIPEEDLLLIINDAQIKLVNQKAGSKNFRDIEFLIEPAEAHKLELKEANPLTHRFTASLSGITDYMHYVDSYILADKGGCKNRVVWVNPDLVGQASIPTLLNNSNYKPSFEYQETFCDEVKGEIGIYTDGTFTPTALYLSYIRYPKKVDKEGYEDFQGNPSQDQDSEFPEYLENELLDSIETSIKLYTENPAYAASLQKELSNKS